MSGMQFPDILMTDTVGFIQKLPTHLVAAFRATLEELEEADVLLVSKRCSCVHVYLRFRVNVCFFEKFYHRLIYCLLTYAACE